MTDTPNAPGDGAPTGEPGPGAAGATPWYQQPVTWIIVAAAAVLIVVVLIVALSSDDDDTAVEDGDSLTSEPTETDPPEATDPPETDPPATDPPATDPPATDPPATDPPATDPPATDPPEAGPEPVVVETSPVNAVLQEAPFYDALPWDDDVEVTAHWYTWEENFVVVYAGWEASEDAPLCPGNSLETFGFDFVSNSPSHEGGCEPEEEFINLVPVDDDDPAGARACGSLVLYRTIIPTTDDGGNPTQGNLYGSVEQALGEGAFNGATSAAEIADGITELDPTADAYSVPDGWLPGGETEVVC